MKDRSARGKVSMTRVFRSIKLAFKKYFTNLFRYLFYAESLTISVVVFISPS